MMAPMPPPSPTPPRAVKFAEAAPRRRRTGEASVLEVGGSGGGENGQQQAALGSGARPTLGMTGEAEAPTNGSGGGRDPAAEAAALNGASRRKQERLDSANRCAYTGVCARVCRGLETCVCRAHSRCRPSSTPPPLRPHLTLHSRHREAARQRSKYDAREAAQAAPEAIPELEAGEAEAARDALAHEVRGVWPFVWAGGLQRLEVLDTDGTALPLLPRR